MNDSDDVTTPEEQVPEPSTVEQPRVPLFMNNTLTIQLERREEFLAALRQVLPAARAEPSCLYLHVGESVAEPGVFVLSEGWKDLAEYRDAIRHKPYFQAYLRVSENAYARPRVVIPLTPIDLDR